MQRKRMNDDLNSWVWYRYRPLSGLEPDKRYVHALLMCSCAYHTVRKDKNSKTARAKFETRYKQKLGEQFNEVEDVNECPSVEYF